MWEPARPSRRGRRREARGRECTRNVHAAPATSGAQRGRHLQRGLQRGRVVVAAPEHQQALLLLQLLRQLQHLAVQLEHLRRARRSARAPYPNPILRLPRRLQHLAVQLEHLHTPLQEALDSPAPLPPPWRLR
jgi:hypothetical protein